MSLESDWMAEATRWKKIVAALLSKHGATILDKGHMLRVTGGVRIREEVTHKGLHLSLEFDDDE